MISAKILKTTGEVIDLSIPTQGSEIKLSQADPKGDQTITASVEVKNNGKFDGEEVVQLYIRDVVGSVTRPVKELKGFQKVALKAGETQTISFTITPEALKFYNSDLKYDWEAGEFQVMIGGNSRDVKVTSINWTK